MKIVQILVKSTTCK